MAIYIQPAWQRNAKAIVETAGYITREQLLWLKSQDIAGGKPAKGKDQLLLFAKGNSLVEYDGIFYPVLQTDSEPMPMNEDGTFKKPLPNVELAGASPEVTDEIWFILFMANFVKEKLNLPVLDLAGLHRYKSDFFNFHYMMQPGLRQPRIRLRANGAELTQEEIQSIKDSLNLVSHLFEIRSIGDYDQGFDYFAGSLYHRILMEKDGTRYLEKVNEMYKDNLAEHKEIFDELEQNHGKIKSNSIIIVRTRSAAVRFFKDFYTKGPYTYSEFPLTFWLKVSNTKFETISMAEIKEGMAELLQSEG